MHTRPFLWFVEPICEETIRSSPCLQQHHENSPNFQVIVAYVDSASWEQQLWDSELSGHVPTLHHGERRAQDFGASAHGPGESPIFGVETQFFNNLATCEE